MKKKIVFAALFAAFIAACRFIAAPISPLGVPIVLQNMAVVLAGSIMGLYGAAATAIFILAGLIGFPVFASGQTGIAVLFSPTGGFIIGYLAASFITGLILRTPRPNEKRNAFLKIKIIIAVVLGFAFIYFFGVLRLSFIIMQAQTLTFSQSLKPALAAGFLPFILGDIIKTILAVFITVKIRPIAANYLN
ncbi:MAG: biotin transporter BioY [Elusimicrobiota bacterium]|jgi:biotin transport system substrate-specific component|nr:biotin transporter BioY [Elusimicrobiota bacterium]